MSQVSPSLDVGRLPLEGLRVLEFGHYIAAPHAAQLLGDQGATVIKVEPTTGEMGRMSLPKDAYERSLYFAAHNRGKLSLALDLKATIVSDLMPSLLRWAEVIITNYGLGVPDRLGFGLEHLHAAGSHAILVHITGFDEQSTYRSAPAFDGVIQAVSGMASMTGEGDGDPQISQVYWADHLAANQAAFAAVAALRGHQQGDSPKLVALNMLDSVSSVLGHLVPEALMTNHKIDRKGSRSLTRFAGIYRCSNGYIYVAPFTASMWESLGSLLGRDLEEWAQLFREQSYLSMPEVRGRIDQLIEQWLAGLSRESASAIFGDYGIASSVVLSVRDRYSSDANQKDAPTVAVGYGAGVGIPVAAPSVRIVPTTGSYESRVPELGANSLEVLRSIGVAETQIEELVSAGVIVHLDRDAT